jgi:hypothetical protein
MLLKDLIVADVFEVDREAHVVGQDAQGLKVAQDKVALAIIFEWAPPALLEVHGQMP